MGVIKTIGNKQYQKDDAGDWYEVPVREDNPITKTLNGRTYQKDNSGNWFDMGETVKKKENSLLGGVTFSGLYGGSGSEKNLPTQPKDEATGLTSAGNGTVSIDAEKDAFRDGVPETKADVDRREEWENLMNPKNAEINDPNDPVKSNLSTIRKDIDFSYLPNVNRVDNTFSKQPIGRPTKSNLSADREKADKTAKAVQNEQLVKQYLKYKFFPDTESAQKYLQEANPKEDNETGQLAAERINDYNKVAENIDKHGSIVMAARGDYEDQNKNFKDKLDVMAADNFGYAPIPNSLEGRITANYINEHAPEIDEYVKKHPDKKEDWEDLQQNILTRFPDFGINIVANEVSRERQKRGLNSKIANFDTNAFERNTDKVAADLYKDNPQKMAIYNSMKGDLKKYIDVGGFFNRAEESIENRAEGAHNSISRLWGGNGDTRGDKLYQELEKEGNSVNTGAQGWAKSVDEMGDLTGTVAFMAAGGNLLQGAGLPANFSNKLITGTTFLDDELKEGMNKYPKEKWKGFLSGAANTAAFMTLSDIFPSGKVNEALDGAKKEFSQTISQLDNKTITKEALKDALSTGFKKALSYSGEFAKQHAKGVLEMTGLAAFNRGLDKMLGMDKNSFHQYHPENELEDVAKMMAVANLPASATIAYGALRDKGYTKDALYDIAENPKRMASAIEELRVKNPKLADQLENKLKDIQYLSDVKGVLDEKGIPKKQQKSYLLHAINDKNLTEQIANTQEPSLKKELQAGLKLSQEVKEGILKGQTEEHIIKKQAKNFVQELYDEDLLSDGDKLLLETEGKFNENKVDDYLKYIAQQSNNLGENWKPHGNEFQIKELPGVPKILVDAANERWAKKIDESKNTEKEIYAAQPKTEPPTEQPSTIPEQEIDYRGQHILAENKTTADRLAEGGTGFDWETVAQDHDLSDKPTKESYRVLNKIKNNPDSEVTIYRSVPNGIDKINEGDWITLSPTYAKEHGMHEDDAAQDMPVISMKVKAKDIVWDGNDLNEFAYKPQEKSNETTTENNPEDKQGPQSTEEGPPSETIPPETSEATEEGEQNTVGIRHESLKKVADKMGLKPPERGTFLSPEEQTKRGRLLLQGGVDPMKVAEDFKEEGKVSPDMISVARAHFENIVKEAQSSLDKYGRNSEEFAKAKFEMQKWQDEVLKPMGTASGSSFSALQGENDLDTGSFVAVSNAFENETGKAPDKNQGKKIQELTETNKKLKQQTDELEAKLIEATDKALAAEKEKPTSIKEKAKKAADVIRRLKSTRPDTFSSGVPIWDAAVEIVAKAVEAGGELADAIQKGIEHIKNSEWYKGIDDDKKNKAEQDFKNALEGTTRDTLEAKNIKRLEKELENLRKGIAKQGGPKRDLTEKEKELQDEIFEEKKKLGLISSKELPQAKVEKTAEQKNIERLEKELENIQNGILKERNPKRELTDKEKELKEEIFEAKKRLGAIPSKDFPKTSTSDLKEEEFKSQEPTGKERSKMEKPLTEVEQKEIDDKELEEVQKQFVDKKGNKFTTEEAKTIWNYAKKNYLDKGVSYKDMIAQVSNDLGLTWKQVSDAITTPKVKRISDAMWKKQADMQRNKAATKNWIDTQTKNPFLKALKAVSGVFRGISVFGHGGIFVGTHAGMTLFHPSTWSKTIPAFFRGWKFAYGNKASYERRMEELKNRKNYVLAQRAGLKNNPDRLNAEEYQKSQHFLGKLGLAGERGFNAIKVLRQDLFDFHYNALSNDAKQDPQSAISIAKLVNNATGASNLKIPEVVNELTFAGGMEAARWGKLTRNPIKATTTALKALFAPSKATTGEKVFAKVWAKRVGEQLATFTSLLVANAAIQNTLNPKNPVNLTNPNKPDFMKFKFGDITVDPTSGMRGVEMFMYGIGKIPFESQKQLKGDTRMQAAGKQGFGYGRGKLAPLYSTMADFYTQQDFGKNPLPFSNDKPTSGHHKLTWKEYAWEHAPLPIAEAANVTYQSAMDNGADKVTLNNFLTGLLSGGISGTTGFRVGEYNSEESNHSPFNDEDKKDPTFKFFSTDWGMELPNTVASSENITDEAKGTDRKLSTYPQDVQDKYMEKHKELLKDVLSEVKDNGVVYVKNYVDENGNPKNKVSLNPPKTGDYDEKELKKLSLDEKTKVLKLAQDEATTRTKKELFPKE